ncbi:MAG: hypothetical protein GY810_27245 [Aureispira sp.]|nr:hypothetical protein [Aureispira sp.]
MNTLDSYLVVGILVFFGLLETFSGYLKNSKRAKADWIEEITGFIALSTIIKPLMVYLVIIIGQNSFPSFATYLQSYSLWMVFVVYLFVDDFMQYCYHRFAHRNAFLWKLHRTHHQAEEMGFFVSYRNAALYYLIMPNIWWMGVITFLGGGKAVAIGLVLKQFIIISSHSRVSWDKPLYKIKGLAPLLAIIEKIIITPAFHHAHHGKSKLDGISDPNGNFGNMFSIWDQLFGTALYTHQFPTEYGLPKPTKDSWTSAYLYPFVKSSDQTSELSSAFKKEQSSTAQPISIQLVKGKKYLWCKCGLSKTQPFCDGNHHGTAFKPVLFEAQKTGTVQLCNCKHTAKAPFCDNSHKNLIS